MEDFIIYILTVSTFFFLGFLFGRILYKPLKTKQMEDNIYNGSGTISCSRKVSNPYTKEKIKRLKTKQDGKL